MNNNKQVEEIKTVKLMKKSVCSPTIIAKEQIENVIIAFKNKSLISLIKSFVNKKFINSIKAKIKPINERSIILWVLKLSNWTIIQEIIK